MTPRPESPSKHAIFSFTAFTLPGRVVTSEWLPLMVPATGLARAAKAVWVKDDDSMRCTRPDASLSMSGLMALKMGL